MPANLDAAVPILFWEGVEITVALMMLGFGVAFDVFLFGLIAFVAVLIYAPKLRRGAKRGASQHYLWFIGLNLDPGLVKAKIKPQDREFLD